MSWDVFIAFANEDGLGPAVELRAALKRLGVTAFVATPRDADGIFDPPVLDRPWDQAIREAHQSAARTVVVMTPAALASHHVHAEVQRALRWHKERRHGVLPWAPALSGGNAAGQDRDEWPSGLSIFSLAEPSAAELAERIAKEIRGPTTAPPLTPGDPTTAALAPLTDAELDMGKAHMEANRFELALVSFEHAARLAAVSPDLHVLHARAQLNQVAALLALERFDAVDAVLAQVRAEGLPEKARQNFGRFLASSGQFDRALEVAHDSEAVFQLVMIRRDGVAPRAPVDDSEVRASAAILYANEGRASTAIGLALLVGRDPKLLRRGRRVVAEVLLRCLYRWWVGMSSETVERPGEALEVARGLLAGNEAAWPEVEQVRRLVELEPVEGIEDQGGRDEAPEWMRELRAGAGRAAIEKQAAKLPNVGLLHRALAYARRGEGDLPGAADAARTAFELLPGRGQRRELCLVLLDAGRNGDAEALAAPLLDEAGRDWEIWARLVDDHAERVERLRAWTEREPDDHRAWFWLTFELRHLARVDEARTAAYQAIRFADRYSTHALGVLGAVAIGGGRVDPKLAALVADALRQDADASPQAAGMRMELLLALGDGGVAQLDFPALEAAGHLTRFDRDEAAAFMRGREQLVALIDRGWASGIIGFETWAKERGIRCGETALALQEREFHVVPNVPHGRSDAPTWDGARCLVGALAIEILVATDLHRVFGDRIGVLVIFSDVLDHVANGTLAGFVASLEREIRDRDDLWAPLDSLPVLNGTTLAADDTPALRAWLGVLGHLPQQDGAAWAPPAGPVTLGADAIRALGTELMTFVRACRAEGVELGVSRSAQRLRADRKAELAQRQRAVDLAAEAHRWLGDLDLAGKLWVIPVPPPPPLPPPRDGTLDDHGPDLSARTWAPREALVADPELVLISAEYAEWGLDGMAPAGVLLDRAWDEATYTTHITSYAGIGARVCTIGHVVRAIAAPDRQASSRRLLAAAGYVDALDGADVVALFDEYGDLMGARPLEILRGAVAWARGDDPLAPHAVLAMHVSLRLVAGPLEDVWKASTVDDRTLRATRSILDVAEDLDRLTCWRFSLLSDALGALATVCLGNARWFIQHQDETTAQLGDASPGARLWLEIARWASSMPTLRDQRNQANGASDPRHSRVAALHRGLASALADPDLAWDRQSVRAVVAIMLLQLPGPAGKMDLGGDGWATALRRSGFADELAIAAFLGHSFPEWIAGAMAADRPSLDGLALEATVLLDAPRAEALVRLPLDLWLDSLGPELGHALRDTLLVLDARVADAAGAWAENPSMETRSALVFALGRCPLNAVTLDPRAVLSWSRYRSRDPVAVTSPAALCALLDDPLLTLDLPATDRLQRKLERATGGHGLAALLTQLGRMPGNAIGSGARALMDGDDLSDARLTELIDMADHPEDYAAGSIADAIVALSVAGVSRPHRQLGPRQLYLPTVAATLAVASLQVRASKQSEAGVVRARDAAQRATPYAEQEPALVRQCGAIVLGLFQRANTEHWIWLSWRLYGWLVTQILACPDPESATRDLVRAAPAPRPPEETSPDLYDPRRLASDRIDIRELAVLQALAFSFSAGRTKQERTDNVRAALDWDAVAPTLTRIATRQYTADEAALRERCTNGSLGGQALTAPDLARLVLLGQVDRATIWTLEAVTRMAWLDDALRVTPDAGDLRIMRDLVLLSFVLKPERLSAAERIRLVEGLGTPGFPVSSPLATNAIIATSGFPEARRGGHDDLDARADAALLAWLPSPTGPELAAEWLLARASRGHRALSLAVAQLRAWLHGAGTDELPYLHGLGRVVMSPHRAEAAPVLRALATEPALADGLSELIAFVDN
jgi:tetratricopeptide (TPR) repeat protein